ncbi:kinase-like protein [Exidia glandulosa HHB12029]|uniref:non-specific serine/threonine protein kinase n=1 Tax=Exidia glandulosa HHB12029 TaxID=1314781 RepID=A0A165CL60_EXIGL|nr:kinase-like protein [Exidia glandulosa HHB12029]
MYSCLPLGIFSSWYKTALAQPLLLDSDEINLQNLSSEPPSRTPSPTWDEGLHTLDITPHISHVSPEPCKRGGMADIFDGIWTNTNGKQKVAIKVVRVPDSAGAVRLALKLRQEVEVWNQLNHPNILPFCGLYSRPLWKLSAMVSPWCRNGDMNAYLKACERRGYVAMRRVKLDLIAQVLAGVGYLHSRVPKIVHADIKGANVLISNQGVARLSDFGFATVLAEDYIYSKQHSVGGTWRWMAPELHIDSGHTTQSDIWACGCLFIEVQSGLVPYHTKPAEAAVILAQFRQELPPRPPRMTDDIWDLIMQCCRFDPHDRPNIALLRARVDVLRALIKTQCTDDIELSLTLDSAAASVTQARDSRDSSGSVQGQLRDFNVWVPDTLKALNWVVKLHPIVQDIVFNLECAIGPELRRSPQRREVRLVLMSVLDIGDALLDLVTTRGSRALDEAFNHDLQCLLSNIADNIENCSRCCEAYAHLPYLARVFTRSQWNREWERSIVMLGTRKRDIARAFGTTADPNADSRQSELVQLLRTVIGTEEQALSEYVEQYGGISRFLRDEQAFNALQSKLNALSRGSTGRTVEDEISWEDVQDVRAALWDADIGTMKRRHSRAFYRQRDVVALETAHEVELNFSEDICT